MKGTQATMATTWHGVILEHKVICVSFFTYGTSLKLTSNPLVMDTKDVFLDPL